MHKIKLLFYLPLYIPAILVFLSLNQDSKDKIIQDLKRWNDVQYRGRFTITIWLLVNLLVAFQSFRSVYYMRVGHWGKILKYFLKPMPLLSMATKCNKVGGGLFVQHGWSTVLDAESVGENLWINQNVTVGYIGNGHPTIGNNVRIGTGAVVLGGITIGDNVNIGANAIVVDDVPSNCTVCSPKATIVRRF